MPPIPYEIFLGNGENFPGTDFAHDMGLFGFFPRFLAFRRTVRYLLNLRRSEQQKCDKSTVVSTHKNSNNKDVYAEFCSSS